MAYAGSSAKLLTKLISEDHDDKHRWEVSLLNFTDCDPRIVLP